MLKLNSWTLKDIVHFKDAHVDVKKGLHIVRGLNKASRNKNQSNGAGKSLLFSPLANVFVGSPPINSKKKTKADILSKKSCGHVSFRTHDKRDIEVFQYLDSYKIIENGKDLEIKTSSKAEKQIREYFPISPLEFYSTCYLTTQPHPFQVASANDRLKFISDLFRLHDYDIVRKHFTAKLRSIKDSETEYRTLQTEANRCEGQLVRIKWSDDKQEELDGLVQKLKDIQDKLNVLQEELVRYSKMGIVHNQYQNLQKKLQKIGQIKNPKSRLEKLKDVKKQCELYVEYERDLNNYNNTTKRIKKQIAEKSVRFSVEQAKRLLDEAHVDFEKVESMYEISKNTADYYKEQLERQSKLKKEFKQYAGLVIEDTVESLTEKMYEAKSLLSLQKLLTDDDCDNVKCPTCKSDFEQKKLKKIVAKAKNDYTSYSEQLEALNLRQQIDEIDVPEFDVKKHQKIEEEYDEISSYVKECKKQYDLAKEKASLEEMLESVKKPKRVEDNGYDLDDINKQIVKCEEYIRIQSEIESLIKEHDLEHDYDSDIESSLRSKYNNLSKILTSTHESIKSLESTKAEHNLLTSNLMDIQRKLVDLSVEIESKKVTEALVAAYGPKGIKINVINNLCANLEANFNIYSKLIYNENFEFEFGVDSNGIDVIAHRSRGLMADIRTLSGAESDAFRLLFLTALLPMIPEDRRMNVLIMDEPLSHGDPVSREKFIHDFLPHMRTVVPSIYIMEPQVDNYPDADNLLVIKEKGVSRLTEDNRQY